MPAPGPHEAAQIADQIVDALNRGDTQDGPRNFLLALDIAERFGSPAHRVNSLSNLASSQHDLGNDEDAIPLLVEALEIIGTQKLKYQQTIVSANLAMCLLATGKPAEALALVTGTPRCRQPHRQVRRHQHPAGPGLLSSQLRLICRLPKESHGPPRMV